MKTRHTKVDGYVDAEHTSTILTYDVSCFVKPSTRPKVSCACCIRTSGASCKPQVEPLGGSASQAHRAQGINWQLRRLDC